MSGPKKISFKDFRARTAGWRSVHTGSIPVPGTEEDLEFFWVSPSGKDLALLHGVIDEDAFKTLGKDTAAERAAVSKAVRANLDLIGEFLCLVLCDSDGNPEYPGGSEELFAAGFSSVDAMPLYMEMFSKIVKSVNDAKKKRPSKKSPRKKPLIVK